MQGGWFIIIKSQWAWTSRGITWALDFQSKEDSTVYPKEMSVCIMEAATLVCKSKGFNL